MYSDRARRIKKIIAQSTLSGVDPALSLGIAEQENKFLSTISSDKLSAGIFQIKPSSAEQVLGFPVTMQRLIDDEDLNIKAGILYLKWLIRELYNDIPAVIASYNHGKATVQAGKINFGTDVYTQNVLGYQAGWKTYLETV